MAEIESELKLKNWLSIATYDIVKYVAAGGEVLVHEGDGGLTITLPGINLSSEGVHKKFTRLVTESENEVQHEI
jgi:hypothetical protein